MKEDSQIIESRLLMFNVSIPYSLFFFLLFAFFVLLLVLLSFAESLFSSLMMIGLYANVFESMNFNVESSFSSFENAFLNFTYFFSIALRVLAKEVIQVGFSYPVDFMYSRS